MPVKTPGKAARKIATPSRPPAPAAPRPAARRAAASARGEQRAAAILQAGRAVFAEQGFEAATTAEIAARAGTSEATVFTWFRSKRELCSQVVEDWYCEVTLALAASVAAHAGGDTRRQLAALVQAHLSLFLSEGRGMCALVLTEGRARNPVIDERFAELQRAYTAPLMDLLARGQREGSVRRDVPLRTLRDLVLGPMEHMLWDAVMRPGRRVDVPAAAADLMRLIAPALQPPAPSDAAWARVRAGLRELSRIADAQR